MKIFSNPDWTFLINFLGIFLAILPFILNIKLFLPKHLLLIHCDNYTPADITIAAQDNSVRTQTIKLIFQNLGREVIRKEDLVSDLKLHINNAQSITRVKFETNSEFNTIDAKIEDTKVYFNFDFLEPKKFIKIHMDYDSVKKVTAKVEGKIINGNKLIENIETDIRTDAYSIKRKRARLNQFAFPFAMMGLFISMRLLLLRVFNLDEKAIIEALSQSGPDAIWIYISGLICFVICFVLGWKVSKLFQPFYHWAVYETDWYTKINWTKPADRQK
jgi:hypothetical protein